MDLGLKSKVAIVTGSGQGIGRAIALALAREGAILAINDLNSETGQRTLQEVRELQSDGGVFVADVSDYGAVDKMVSEVVAKFGRLDVLVNNAGITSPAPIHTADVDEWRRVFEVNVFGVFYCMKAVFPTMMSARSGRIISIASFAGKRGTLFGDNTSYSASKTAVMGLTVSLAIEAARYGITVNAVAPGIVETDLLQALPEERRRELSGFPPLKRLGTVDDVARVVTFLASESASYITGEVVDVNGGLYLDL